MMQEYNKNMNNNISNKEKRGLSLLDKIKYDDIIAISIAENGAMGDPGAVIVLNKNLSQCYFHHYNIIPEKLKKKLPIFEGLRLEFGNAIITEKGWDIYYFGVGNYLFIREKYYKKLKQSLDSAKTSGVSSAEICSKWPNLIQDTIKDIQSGNIKDDSISDILSLNEITDKNIAAILVKEKDAKIKTSIIGFLTEELSEYYFDYYCETAEKLKDKLTLFKNLELSNGIAEGVDRKKWGTCYLGLGNYLFIKRKYCDRFQTVCDNEQMTAELLLDNWRYIVKRSIHADIKLHKISAKELRGLKEEDVLFITVPGRMGDETGSTFVIKVKEGFVAYRVDWAIKNPKISAQDIGLVFPQWYKYDKKNSRYIRISIGLGNWIYVKKDIIEDYIPLLRDAIHDEFGYDEDLMCGDRPIPKKTKTGDIPTIHAGAAAFRPWGYAVKLMLGDKLQ